MHKQLYMSWGERTSQYRYANECVHIILEGIIFRLNWSSSLGGSGKTTPRLFPAPVVSQGLASPTGNITVGTVATYFAMIALQNRCVPWCASHEIIM